MGDGSGTGKTTGLGSPPIFDPECREKSYEVYRTELSFWAKFTSLPKRKMGLAVALSLPEGSNIRTKLFSELSIEDLDCDSGLTKLLEYLDKIYLKDDLISAREIFTEFIRFTKKDKDTMESYIMEFDRLYRKAEKYDILKVANGAKGFMLLESAKLEHKDEQLVLTGVNFDEKDRIHEQMSASLIKFHGKQVITNKDKSGSIQVKDEDSFYSAGYKNRGASGGYSASGRGASGGYSASGRGNSIQFQRQNKNQYSPVVNTPKKKMNWLDSQGNVTRCRHCGSKFHYVRGCPDRDVYEKPNVYETTHISDENYDCENKDNMPKKDVYLTGNIHTKSTDMLALVTETFNCAVLDTACSSTVCGGGWANCYLDSLDEETRNKVREFQSSTTFRFGNDETLKSIKRLEIPCTIAGEVRWLSTDVVSSEVPLLLGKPTMKKLGLKLDMENDTAIILGHKIKLQCTPSGHYYIPLTNPDITVLNTDNVLNVLYTSLNLGNVKNIKYALEDKSHDEKLKIARKLHNQFGHTSARPLKLLLKDAGVVDSRFLALIEEVTVGCDVCKRHSRTPSRPIVSFSLARDFNETVAMDLKIWDKENNIYILHLIDLATRFSVATVIRNKEADTIIDKIMQCWVGTGLGIPVKFL